MVCAAQSAIDITSQAPTVCRFSKVNKKGILAKTPLRPALGAGEKSQLSTGQKDRSTGSPEER